MERKHTYTVTLLCTHLTGIKTQDSSSKRQPVRNQHKTKFATGQKVKLPVTGPDAEMLGY